MGLTELLSAFRISDGAKGVVSMTGEEREGVEEDEEDEGGEGVVEEVKSVVLATGVC